MPGGQGVGYYDLDPNRNDPSDPDWVDVADRDGATVVKTNQEGEWAKYEVNIPKSGMYKVSGRVSVSAVPAGSIKLEWDGELSEEIQITTRPILVPLNFKNGNIDIWRKAVIFLLSIFLLQAIINWTTFSLIYKSNKSIVA